MYDHCYAFLVLFHRIFSVTDHTHTAKINFAYYQDNLLFVYFEFEMFSELTLPSSS